MATTTSPAPVPPTVVPRPGYRDRWRARYTAAAEERIVKAQAAATELGHTGPVPWPDIRATYTRPGRTAWKSFRLLLGGALGAAFLGSILVGLLFIIVFTLETAQKEATAAANKTKVAALSPEAKKQADQVLAKRVGKYTATAFFVIFTVSIFRSSSDKREAMRKGYAKDGDEVVTEALEVLPALATLVSSPAGRARAEALTEVHEKVSELMASVATSTGTAAGMHAKYTADRGRLREHGQKVCTALTDKLGELVEDRERSARELGAMALTVAGRQAQTAYGALLDADVLPAEPGPEALDVKGLRKVFTIAGIAAAVSLFIAPAAGAEGAGLLFIPLTVFALAAFLAAAFTRNLHQLGRVFAMFGRGGDGSGGGVI